jgi:hypothetical protein
MSPMLVRTVDETHKAGGLVIGEVYGCSADNTEANARLIAAAPDLQEMLVEALPYVEESEQFNKPSCRTLSKRIRAKIAELDA